MLPFRQGYIGVHLLGPQGRAALSGHFVTSALGAVGAANFRRDYSTISVRPSSAGTLMVGSLEVAKGLSWWPNGGANGPYHHQGS